MSPKTKTLYLLALVFAVGCARITGDDARAEYDPETGRLRVFAYDSNKDGKHDTVSYMDGTRILRIELDLDGNGQVDRWDFYGEDRTIEKVGFSSLNDGVMDAQAFYDAEDGLIRMEISTSRDGSFDRIEHYERGVLARSEEDTNGDGRPDKWETYRPEPSPGPGEPAYAITSTAFDHSGSGRPDRRFVYGTDGSIVRVEIDPTGVGR